MSRYASLFAVLAVLGLSAALIGAPVASVPTNASVACCCLEGGCPLCGDCTNCADCPCCDFGKAACCETGVCATAATCCSAK